MKIIVIGAGAWGTALAVSAAARHTVALWARDAKQAHTLATTRRNQRYLPGVDLPAAVTVQTGPPAALGPLAATQDLVIIATPMAGLRATLAALQGCAAPVA